MTDGAGGTVAFTCHGCGGPTSYQPAGLTCEVCGRITPVDPPADPRERRVRRRPLRPIFDGEIDDAPAIPDDLKWQLQCPKCGGGAAYVGTLRASWCPFCAAPVATEDVREFGGRLPIDGVIPFQVEAEDAHRSVRRWLYRAWFAPQRVRLRTKATQYSRVYLPVLTVDAHLVVDYSYMRGVLPAEGSARSDVRDIVVSAGTVLPQERIDEFRPWPMKKLVPYRPEYLAGAFCESYDRSLAEIREMVRDSMRERGWELAKFAVDQEQKESESRIDFGPLIKISCESSEEGYRHVLLPVFLVTTRLGDEVRQVVVSGIDGSIGARVPLSWVKLIAATVVTVATAGGLVWLDYWQNSGS
jgi:hypothetical protein